MAATKISFCVVFVVFVGGTHSIFRAFSIMVSVEFWFVASKFCVAKMFMYCPGCKNSIMFGSCGCRGSAIRLSGSPSSRF